MRIRDAFGAKAIALYNKETASNAIPYLGAGLFPPRKKMGLDLKWIKTSKGLPVSLSPSAFDAKSTIRSREGFKMDESEMAFFRESMIVSEKDEQEIMRIQDANDPYAAEIIRRIYDDANTLVAGANVVPERMIWQLLAPVSGTPQISIQANGATYAYNYDPAGTFASTNFANILGFSMWDQVETADPLEDVRQAQEAIELATGVKPEIMVVSAKTMGWLRKNKNIRSAILAQNVTANVFMNDARVKEAFLNELGVQIVVYSKKYKDEAGVAANFYPDNMVTLLPRGELGNMWYGTTPEERTLMGTPTADVSATNTGVAIAVSTTEDPVNTKTTVSEICLPSFERMDEVYVMKVHTDDTATFTGVVAAGAAAGAKITITGSAGTGNAFYVKLNAGAQPYGSILDESWATYTSGSDIAPAKVGDYATVVVANSTSKQVLGSKKFYIDAIKA